MDLDDLIEVDIEDDENLEDDDELEEEYIEDIINYKHKKNEKNITLPVMTRYEKSVIISKRIKQLDNNYKTTIPEIVKKEKLTKSFDIAMKEFQLGKLPPYIIKRTFKDGTYEEWKHEDFKYFPQI